MFGRSSKPIRVQVFARTDLGKTREHNEDCFLVADLTRGERSADRVPRQHELGERGSLLVVADGMGGAAAGEIASVMATDTIFEQMRKMWGAEKEATAQRFAYRLKEAVEVANTHIHTYAKAHPEVRGMGTTTTAAGVLNADLDPARQAAGYAAAGAAAISVLIEPRHWQRLVEAGELTEEEAAQSERRNIILQALGPDPKVKVDLTHQELRRGDLLVLCSDGLSGLVKKEEIAEAVGPGTDLAGAAERLIALANERGGPDNITVIIARFDGEGLRPPDGGDDVGHQVYPLIDTETSTEPVPVYRGSPAPVSTKQVRWRVIAAALLGAAIVAAVLYLAARNQ